MARYCCDLSAYERALGGTECNVSEQELSDPRLAVARVTEVSLCIYVALHAPTAALREVEHVLVSLLQQAV